jgi:hypothetical protein
MSTQADIKSTDTLVFVKTALAAFAHETGQALSEIEIQSQRAVDWVTVDQAAYWKAEVRRAADQVNKAIKDLEHCRAFKKVGDNQPSCIEEKKALEKARRRLEYTEQKAELVRRWTPVLQQQFREACVRLVRFREVIDLDCPKAMARLDQMLRALDAYATTRGPEAVAVADNLANGPSMTRATEDSASSPAPPPQAAPVSTPEGA